MYKDLLSVIFDANVIFHCLSKNEVLFFTNLKTTKISAIRDFLV